MALAAVALGYDKFGPAGGTDVPATITVEGEQYQLRDSKVLIYFFNPTCLHCLAVGKELSKYEFAADFIGVPTQDPDFGPGFLYDAGLTGMVDLSPDLDLLKETFPFHDVPYAATVDNGVVTHRFTLIDLEEPENGAGSQPLDPAGVESTQPDDDDEAFCVERPPLFVMDVESSDEVSVM